MATFDAVTPKAEVSVTPKAIEKIRQAFAKEGITDGFLRLGVLGGGCSGLSYQFKFDTRRRPTDHVFEFDGVKIVVRWISKPRLAICGAAM